METPAARAALDGTGDVRMMAQHWKRRDVDSSSARLRCWQPGEVEVEDRWGIGSMSPRPHSFAVPDDRLQALKKLASRQLQGSRRLQQAGHRLFSCFRHSTLNLRVQDTAPSTPPKSGPLPGQRTSLSGVHALTFKGDALDLHTDRSQVLNAAVEPTSPVVNCMGQVISNKMLRHGKTTKTTEVGNNIEMEMEMEADMDVELDRLRRTKSQSARGLPLPSSPPGVWRSKSSKWKQLLLLRSNSSSISPTSFFSHPSCEGEPQIDLCRFSSATPSSEPFYQRDFPADRKPDKTCLLMQQSLKQSPKPGVYTELSHEQQQHQQLYSRSTEAEHGNSRAAYGNSRGEHGSSRAEYGNSRAAYGNSRSGHGNSRAAYGNSRTDYGSSRAGHGNSRAEAELVVRNLPKLKTKRMESPKWLADEPALQRRQQGLLLFNNKPSLRKSSETSSSHA